MIENVSQILQAIIKQEDKKLREYKITHGPTIGKMYEGLSSDILKRVIPKKLNLKIVSGFIFDDTENMTGQIDCMLVSGEGFNIPYTSDYKWHIKDVIAVFEIKKSLYTNDLVDSIDHLRGVIDSFGRHLKTDSATKFYNVTTAYRIFSQLTGVIIPNYEKVSELPLELEMLFHSLVAEQISPLRIVWGYDGFKSEYDMRKKFVQYLNDNLMQRGYGVRSIPQLIISGNNSFVKINGIPFITRLDEGWWHVLVSSNHNPIKLLLELLWTKLERKYKISGFWGDDLLTENLHPFIKARIKKENDVIGWEYNYQELSKINLASIPCYNDWEPVVLTEEQHVVIALLCKGKSISLNDEDFKNFVTENGHTINGFKQSLLETGLVGIEGNEIKLVTRKCECVFLPDGRIIAAENNTGRLTRWVEKQYSKKEV